MTAGQRRTWALRISALAAGIAFGTFGAGCGSPAPADLELVVVARAPSPVALTPDGTGGLLYGERLTGLVRRVDPAGDLEPAAAAHVDVSTDGQRGLLGVAIDPARRVFAAYTATEPGRPILVAQVAPVPRLVWTGPPSSTLANGGHLVYDPRRGRLVIGIGDLQHRAAVADADSPNGKLLLLDPDGAPSQRPVVLSSGWNNPFAFALTSSGALWVADNVPGQRGERLARGDRDGRPSRITLLPTDTVPSALAAPTDDTLIVCSFAQARTLRFEVRSGRAVAAPGFGDDAPCRAGVARRGPRALWLATDRSIRVVTAR